MAEADEWLALRGRCTRAISGHGQFTAAEHLASIPVETQMDMYGDGGVVAELEAEVAALLGKPAAAFLPSGTMAQQIALRVHADRRGRRTVLFHPTCHIDEQEGRGYERLHGLVGRPVGGRSTLLSLEDLTAVAEPAAALVLELPQRELGGTLPAWHDVEAQIQWARGTGAAVHLDGARVWEAAAGFGRTPREVVALFDSAYVSFYKGLGGISGCALVGDGDLVAEAKEWRRRHGGTLVALWPAAASALTSLRRRLPLMPAYLAHARAIAVALQTVPGVTVLPDPPHTPMMHLLLAAPADAIAAVARRLAEDEGLWTWRATSPTDNPAVQRVELNVGDATCRLSADEVRDAVAELMSGAG